MATSVCNVGSEEQKFAAGQTDIAALSGALSPQNSSESIDASVVDAGKTDVALNPQESGSPSAVDSEEQPTTESLEPKHEAEAQSVSSSGDNSSQKSESVDQGIVESPKVEEDEVEVEAISSSAAISPSEEDEVEVEAISSSAAISPSEEDEVEVEAISSSAAISPSEEDEVEVEAISSSAAISPSEEDEVEVGAISSSAAISPSEEDSKEQEDTESSEPKDEGEVKTISSPDSELPEQIYIDTDIVLAANEGESVEREVSLLDAANLTGITITSDDNEIIIEEKEADADVDSKAIIDCSLQESHVVCGGFVAEGYEDVRDLFFKNFRKGHIEECAQVSAYVRGELVVNLWASRVKKKPTSRWGLDESKTYGSKGIQNIFSSSKAVTSMVVAMLVDRGHLRYDQKVTDVWPEYGQNGKETTTIAQVMKHEAGLQRLSKSVPTSCLTTEGIKANKMGEILEKQKPLFKPGSKREYHMISRGWIINEIVRRADPEGRTVGEFLLQEIATPLGLKDELRIGLPEELDDSVAPLTKRPMNWTFRNILMPKVLGGGKVPGVDGILTRAGWGTLHSINGILQTVSLGIPVGMHPENSKKLWGNLKNAAKLFNMPEVRRAEIPSANCYASAYALAKLANEVVLAYRDGKSKLLSKEGAKAAHGNPTHRTLLPLIQFTFTDGGWCMFKKMRDNYIGWMGLGGSCFNWHLEERIGFGYAMNCLEPNLMNARSLKLQHVVLECAKQVRRKKRKAENPQEESQ